MDSFEFNKIAGAVLGVLLFVMGIGIVANMIFAPPKVEVAGYELPGASEAPAASAGAAAPVVEPIAVRLASADPAKGAVAGFNYSAALKERAAKGEKWGYAELDGFIANPKAYMPGTAMAYACLADAAKRADLVAYLRSLADTPAPLPQ